MFYWYLKHRISRKDLIILPQIFTFDIKMLPCVSSSGSQCYSLGVESISAQVTLSRVTHHLLCFFTVPCTLTITKSYQFTNYISMFTWHCFLFLLCSNSSSSCIFLWSTITHFFQSLVPLFFIHTADLFRVNISVETYDGITFLT